MDEVLKGIKQYPSKPFGRKPGRIESPNPRKFAASRPGRAWRAYSEEELSAMVKHIALHPELTGDNLWKRFHWKVSCTHTSPIAETLNSLSCLNGLYLHTVNIIVCTIVTFWKKSSVTWKVRVRKSGFMLVNRCFQQTTLMMARSRASMVPNRAFP